MRRHLANTSSTANIDHRCRLLSFDKLCARWQQIWRRKFQFAANKRQFIFHIPIKKHARNFCSTLLHWDNTVVYVCVCVTSCGTHNSVLWLCVVWVKIVVNMLLQHVAESVWIEIVLWGKGNKFMKNNSY